MAKKMLIDATHAEETRVVVVDGTRVDDFDFETVNKRQLAGNIYLAKVTRVEPSLQAAFVEYGGNRHGFLAFAEIHPDYYQIPAADRRALIEEERAAAEAAEDEEAPRERRSGKGRRSRGRGEDRAAIAEQAVSTDEVVHSGPVEETGIAGTDQADEDAALESGFAAAGGDIVDVSVEGQGDAAPEPSAEPDAAPAAEGAGEDEDHPAEDHPVEDHPADEIESVAEEDVAEEIRPARKPRARRYKIQEVIKVRQIMLVQVVKEERGNKGAALTTYLSLPGRYCVLMPNTARGGGISRKITNVADRKKLKDIASELEVPQGAGLIIRTAGSERTKTEIKRDYEYLMRLWEQIRERTFQSIAPAAIYEEGDLIKRSIRDLYGKDIDEVWVDGDRGYRTAKDFMAMIMPDQVRAVKHYTDPTPLFARYQVESYLGGMFNPTVQLKSGGYIVIGITEALVAIDVNSGRATKEGSIEDTAFKTNCEAADEIARQLRLRDLAGLIVIDFIDMDERKNNAAVEKRFKDALKTDRARIQVGRISGFGLLEMSRQRLRPGMLESTTQPCAHCHGTGLIRSDDSMALTILRAIEDEGTRRRSREILVKAPVAVANFLMNQKREHIGMIEARYGLSVRLEADPALISPDFTLEKFKTASRAVPEPAQAALSVDARLMAQIDDAEEVAETADTDTAAIAGIDNDAGVSVEAAGDDTDEGRTRRRRRRRRRGGNADDEAVGGARASDRAADDEAAGADAAEAEAAEGDDAEAEGDTARRRGRSRRRRGRSGGGETVEAGADATTGGTADQADAHPDRSEQPADLETAATRSEDTDRDGTAFTGGEPDGSVIPSEDAARERASGWNGAAPDDEANPGDRGADKAAAADGGADTGVDHGSDHGDPAAAEADDQRSKPETASALDPTDAESVNAAEDAHQDDESDAGGPAADDRQPEDVPLGGEQPAGGEAAAPDLPPAPAPAKPRRRGWWSLD